MEQAYDGLKCCLDGSSLGLHHKYANFPTKSSRPKKYVKVVCPNSQLHKTVGRKQMT